MDTFSSHNIFNNTKYNTHSSDLNEDDKHIILFLLVILLGWSGSLCLLCLYDSICTRLKMQKQNELESNLLENVV